MGSLPRRGPKGSRAVSSPKGKPIDSIRPVKWREICAAFLSPRKEATPGFCDLKVGEDRNHLPAHNRDSRTP